MDISGFVRTERGWACLPIIEMVRKKRYIFLVGVMHIASPEFYALIRARLEAWDRAGYRILFEAIDPSPAPRTSEERVAQARLAYKKRMFINRLEGYGLVYQSDHIPIGPTWESADLNPKELRHKMPWLGPKSRADANDQFDRRIDHPEQVVRGLAEMLSDASHAVRVSDVILGQRDEIATQVILDRVEHENVATYWGAAHLPGISQLLEKAGFEHKSREWIPAINVAKLKALTA